MAKGTNTSAISFEAVSASGIDATHWGLFTALTGGDFLYGGSLSNNPAALALGGSYTIAAGAMDIIHTSGASNFSHAGGRRTLAGLLGLAASTAAAHTDGDVFVAVHDGDPALTGANELTASNLTREAVTAWTLSNGNTA